MPSATVRRRINPETIDHQATSNRTHDGDDLTPQSVSGSVTAPVDRARVPVRSSN